MATNPEMTKRALAIATVVTTIAALTTLSVLLARASSALGANDDDDGNGSGDGGGSNDRWWDFDREEQAAFKVTANVAALGIACATLFVPMVRLWHPSKGVYDRFNLGVLAAATNLVGIALLAGFWYSAGAAQREQEGGSNDNNDDGDDGGGNQYDDAYEMDEEELLAYRQKIAATTSLILALAFLALSGVVFLLGKRLPETAGRDDDANEEEARVARARSAAHVELFAEAWKILSAATLTILWILFLVACVLSLGEEGERRREEGGANLTIVLLLLIITTIGMTVLGRKFLNEGALGSLGAGLFSGGTVYYAILLFVVFVLFANPEFGGPGAEGGPAGTATAVACFFLSLMHLTFAMGTCKYRKSMMPEVPDEEDGSVSVDFRRMEDDGSERSVPSEPVKETEMVGTIV